MDSSIDENEKKKKSLRYSTIDGSFYSIMVGFGESFFAAFAVFLQASSSQIALLGSLPQAVGSISQLFASKFIRLFQSRQKFILLSATLQALMHIPLIFAYFLGALSVPVLIISVCLYFLFAMLPGPAWSSWMGDLVSEQERGSYFGSRNQICGACSFIALLVAGYILQEFTNGGLRLLGFICLFVFAMCMRFFSVYYLSKKYEPQLVLEESTTFKLFDFLRTVLFSNYGLYILFLWCMNLGVFVSGPFFAIYMLKTLDFSYVTFTLINATALISKLIFMPIWGKASDKYGTRKLLVLASIFMVPIPAFWIFSSEVWAILCIQIFSGFVWAGFELLSFNFLFDTTEPHRRAKYIAFYNAVNGVFLISGALLGSWLSTLTLFSVAVFTTFIASSLIRLLAVILFLPKLKEVRQVDQVNYRHLLFSVLTVMPTIGLMNQVATFADKRRRIAFEDIDKFTRNISKIAVAPTIGFFINVFEFANRQQRRTFEDIDKMLSRFKK